MLSVVVKNTWLRQDTGAGVKLLFTVHNPGCKHGNKCGNKHGHNSKQRKQFLFNVKCVFIP